MIRTKQWYPLGLPAKNDGSVSSSFLLFSLWPLSSLVFWLPALATILVHSMGAVPHGLHSTNQVWYISEIPSSSDSGLDFIRILAFYFQGLVTLVSHNDFFWVEKNGFRLKPIERFCGNVRQRGAYVSNYAYACNPRLYKALVSSLLPAILLRLAVK